MRAPGLQFSVPGRLSGHLPEKQILLMASAICLCAVTGLAAEWHVSVDGDNAHAGTVDHPFRTIQRAADLAQPGDTITVHAGVYRFHAPEHLYNTTEDAGYDLRMWVGGEHAEKVWSIALEKGLHRFEVSYTDYRWKTFRNEYWMSWREEQMGRGVPVLEMDGPGMEQQPIPAQWLYRSSFSLSWKRKSLIHRPRKWRTRNASSPIATSATVPGSGMTAPSPASPERLLTRSASMDAVVALPPEPRVIT